MNKSLALSLASLLAALGCSSGPSHIKPPSIDAGDAASQAMDMYDKDGDGAIAGSELDGAPALKASMDTLDANKDGAVQEEEIVQRIETWQATKIGIMPVGSGVTLDGRPLVGATVTFDPEPFLGDDIKTAVGETGPSGSATVSIPKDQRPTSDTPAGIQIGFYRVRVSKVVDGKETIPAKYNTETTLGQQVAPDDPAILRQNMSFALTTK
jgi:hypothetical protein